MVGPESRGEGEKKSKYFGGFIDKLWILGHRVVSASFVKVITAQRFSCEALHSQTLLMKNVVCQNFKVVTLLIIIFGRYLHVNFGLSPCENFDSF